MTHLGTFITSKCRYPAAPTLAPASPYVELLGGVLAPPLLRGAPPAPRSPRTCLSIQARRLPRQACSESTIRGQGLQSAMSSAATATARPTCPAESTREGDAGKEGYRALGRGEVVRGSQREEATRRRGARGKMKAPGRGNSRKGECQGVGALGRGEAP